MVRSITLTTISSGIGLTALSACCAYLTYGLFNAARHQLSLGYALATQEV